MGLLIYLSKLSFGNVIRVFWNEINFIRVKADHYKDANSDLQVGHRAKFAAYVVIARPAMDTIIKPIWNKKAV